MLRLRTLRLGYNKSVGHRWSPIPKPPPAHTDRLYGTHSVLSALRVFANSNSHNGRASEGGSQTPAHAQPSSSLAGSSLDTEAGRTLAARISGKASKSLTDSVSARPADLRAPLHLRHPHRSSVTCLYVRDFSIEGDKEEKASSSAAAAVPPPLKPRKRAIPAKYSTLHRLTALAKDAGVPIRFVPRSELWKLCGERRNQGVVLEVASYAPRPVKDAAAMLQDFFFAPAVRAPEGDATAGTETHTDAANDQQVILYLDNIVDPTNVGSILRTGFFFGVTCVVLSPHCAACTPAVARTSAGFLEYMNVARSTVPTAVFLKRTREAFEAMMASFAATPTAAATAAGNGVEANARLCACTLETVGTTAHMPKSDSVKGLAAHAQDLSASKEAPQKRRRCRLVVLGNEDAGLSEEVLAQCTHHVHIRSPRQSWLTLGTQLTAATVVGAETGSGNDDAIESVGLRTNAHARRETELERRERATAKLRRLRANEVSLNVNTACAVLLSRLADAGDGEGTSLTVQLTSRAPTYVVPVGVQIAPGTHLSNEPARAEPPGHTTALPCTIAQSCV